MAPGTTVSALMRGDAFAFVEELDRAGSDARICKSLDLI
jgi:hypothetical protein